MSTTAILKTIRVNEMVLQDYSHDQTIPLELSKIDTELVHLLLLKSRYIVLTRDYYFGFYRFHDTYMSKNEALIAANKLSSDHHASVTLLWTCC